MQTLAASDLELPFPGDCPIGIARPLCEDDLLQRRKHHFLRSSAALAPEIAGCANRLLYTPYVMRLAAALREHGVSVTPAIYNRAPVRYVLVGQTAAFMENLPIALVASLPEPPRVRLDWLLARSDRQTDDVALFELAQVMEQDLPRARFDELVLRWPLLRAALR